VNNEGRAQRSYQVYVPQGDIQASWKWINDILMAAGRPEADGLHPYETLVKSMASALPSLAAVTQIAPPASFRLTGSKIPRQPHRYSGRTSMLANTALHEPKPPDDPDSPLAFSMEGAEGSPPSPLITRYWSPRWNSVQSLNRPPFADPGEMVNYDGHMLCSGTDRTGPRAYFASIPAQFAPVPGTWLLVPLYHLFGTEELSAQAAGIATLAMGPYLALGMNDAKLLGLSPGDAVELSFADNRIECTVAVVPGLQAGIAGFPAGIIPINSASGPLFGSIVKRS